MRRSAAPITRRRWRRPVAAGPSRGGGSGRGGGAPVGGGASAPRPPVHTAWALGVGDATAIWFYQVSGREVRIIDYYEANGVGLDHYARELQRRGYVYGDHILPHDARVQELGSGKTRVETLTALGFRPRVLDAHKLED